jgi:hypothetical protein
MSAGYVCDRCGAANFDALIDRTDVDIRCAREARAELYETLHAAHPNAGAER